MRSGGAREPMFNLPGSLVFVIAFLALVHLVRDIWLTAEADAMLLQALSFVPGRFTFSFNPDGIADELTRLANTGSRNAVLAAQFFLGDGHGDGWSMFTYSILHADWTHLGMNVLWLAAFGAPVALRFGTMRTLAFLLVAAAAGAGAHYLARPVDLTPVVGASASVSGMMAAALRFIFQPGAPLGKALDEPLPPELAVRVPAAPLRAALRDRRVLQFSALWFAINLLIGLFAVPLGISDAGVAWEAHAGGFIAGFLLFGFFDPASRVYRSQSPPLGA